MPNLVIIKTVKRVPPITPPHNFLHIPQISKYHLSQDDQFIMGKTQF